MTDWWGNNPEEQQRLEELGHMWWQNDTDLLSRSDEMPKVGDMFGGAWLKASDLDGKRVRVTIEVVEQVLFTDDKGGEESKWTVKFEGKNKGLVLNKTNATAIAEQHGDDTDGWVGKEIRLYPATTDFGGKVVPCIRVWLDPPDVEEAGADEIPF